MRRLAAAYTVLVLIGGGTAGATVANVTVSSAGWRPGGSGDAAGRSAAARLR